VVVKLIVSLVVVVGVAEEFPPICTDGDCLCIEYAKHLCNKHTACRTDEYIETCIDLLSDDCLFSAKKRNLEDLENCKKYIDLTLCWYKSNELYIPSSCDRFTGFRVPAIVMW
jgi:hypothetical protein